MRVMWIKGEPYKYNEKHAGKAEDCEDFNTEEERDQFLKDYYLIKKFKASDNLTNTEIERLNFIKEHYPERII